jgi:hypothetical protein
VCYVCVGQSMRVSCAIGFDVHALCSKFFILRFVLGFVRTYPRLTICVRLTLNEIRLLQFEQWSAVNHHLTKGSQSP